MEHLVHTDYLIVMYLSGIATEYACGKIDNRIAVPVLYLFLVIYRILKHKKLIIAAFSGEQIASDYAADIIIR